MKATGATDDYKASLERQMELYLWLLSSDGPIAGGCTNSWGGQYQAYPAGQSTFHDMAYLEHPVYADPGSNHWIGNQVWAVQRLAELYYVVKENGDGGVQVGGMSMTAALEKILDRWVGWFMDNTVLGKANATKTFDAYYEPYDTTMSTFTIPDLSKGVTDDGTSFSIPSSLIWSGQPESWTGTYQENSKLTCTIVGYGDGDLGCVSSLANTLIYYAKAKGVSSDIDACKAAYESKKSGDSGDALAQQSLYLAKELLDREWNSFRDDIGLGVSDHNTNLPRLWNTKVVLPNGTRANGKGEVLAADRYTGTMPNGDTVKDGATFVDIRSNYKNSPMYEEALSYYEKDGNCDNYYFTLHRFWHAGDIMMALGTMNELYPDVKPGPTSEDDGPVVTPSEITIAVGETETLKPNKDNCKFDSADSSIASVDENGTVTGVSEGETTITVTDENGKTATVKVTVTAAETTTTTEAATTENTTAETTASDSTETTAVTTVSTPDGVLLGDVNLDGEVDLSDAVLLNKAVAGAVTLNEQATLNADCNKGVGITADDSMSLLKFLVHLINALPE